MSPFHTPWKRQKTWFSDVYKGYRKRTLAWNRLSLEIRHHPSIFFEKQTCSRYVFCSKLSQKLPWTGLMEQKMYQKKGILKFYLSVFTFPRSVSSVCYLVQSIIWLVTIIRGIIKEMNFCHAVTENRPLPNKFRVGSKRTKIKIWKCFHNIQLFWLPELDILVF